MCLILFAHEAHPQYKLIVAANRDEFYARPAARVDWWPEMPDVLAGKDLQADGSWMGIHRSGRFAALTNYREPGKFLPEAPSRGALVTDFLSGADSPAAYLETLADRGQEYNGFNLLTGDAGQMGYYSNRAGKPQLLAPGVYGLSNHLLNTPWPKIRRGRQQLEAAMGTDFDADDLFTILRDPQMAPDHQLPDTGVSLEWERMLSAMFIESPVYGTRVSSVLLVDRQDRVFYEERAHVPEGLPVVFRFPAHSPVVKQSLFP
jgi:uncharacterized protein with NRDE domain